jgi:hypothetical protein
LSTCTPYRESGKLLRFKGKDLLYRLSPSLQECLSASVLSEFILQLDFLPFHLVVITPENGDEQGETSSFKDIVPQMVSHAVIKIVPAHNLGLE